MQELTQQQYKDLFGSSNHDPMFRTLVRQWSERHQQALQLHTRHNLPKPLQYPMLFREQLPECAERVLSDREAAGFVYTGGFFSQAARAARLLDH